jgi:hypothetical protein
MVAVVFMIAWQAEIASAAAPTVTLTKPSNKISVGRSIKVAPVADDDTGLEKIELWGNGAVFATVPCAPASTSCSGTLWWATGALAPGAYEIRAVAVDVEGNRTVSSPVTIYKDAKTPLHQSGASGAGTSAPATLTAGFESPADGGTVCGGVPITMSAAGGSDPDGDDIVTRSWILKVDGTIVFTGPARTPLAQQDAVVLWDTTQYADGPHAIEARVTDEAGTTARATMTLNTRNEGPLGLALTAPANGAKVSGTVVVDLRASGGACAPRAFTLSVDGEQVFAQQGLADTVSYRWDTAASGDGPHTLTGTVTDLAGQVAEASTTVTVANSGGGAGSALHAWFSAPADGATVRGAVEIAMGGSAGGTSTYVLKLDDATTLSTQAVTGSNATFVWSSTSAADGPHTLDLTVTDGVGGTTTARIKVVVANGTGGGGANTAPPAVTITSPQNGWWTGNSIRVTASATGSTGLATLKLYGNGIQFAVVSCGGTPSCGWDDWWPTAALSSGQHTITAVATDLAGNSTTSAPVTINK